MSLYDWENHFLGVFLGKHYCLAWRFEKASEKKRGGKPLFLPNGRGQGVKIFGARIAPRTAFLCCSLYYAPRWVGEWMTSKCRTLKICNPNENL